MDVSGFLAGGSIVAESVRVSGYGRTGRATDRETGTAKEDTCSLRSCLTRRGEAFLRRAHFCLDMGGSLALVHALTRS